MMKSQRLDRLLLKPVKIRFLLNLTIALCYEGNEHILDNANTIYKGWDRCTYQIEMKTKK